MLMPIPSAAPATAGAASAGVPMAPRPHQYQSAPSAPIERGVPARGNQGLVRVITTVVILIVCFLIGSGIYYFINRMGTTSSAIDNSLLSIQNVSVQSTTETGATITWKTNKPATGKVNYGETEEYGLTTQLDTDLSTSHSVTLTGLDSNTTYYFEAISTDDTGTEITKEGSLATLATADKTPPTISGINTSNITESSAIITWMTNEPATSQINYKKDGETASITTADTNLTTTHSIALSKLNSGTTYSFTIIAKDAAGNQATSPSGKTFTTQTAIPVGSQVGNRAPDFTVQNLDGDDVEIKMSDFRGKIVMINFWATWCVPCKDEMPYIQAVSDNWSSEDLVIIAIADNYEETIASVKKFISDKGYTFPVYYDSEGQAKNLYSINTRPTTFFIDDEGIIKYMQPESFSNQAELEDTLNSL
jgi:peroxiredoxin